MITKTKFYDGDGLSGRTWDDVQVDVPKMEADGWAVRQMFQTNGYAMVVVYERESDD